MVDHALVEQVLSLDESARRELRAVIDDSLDDGYVSPEEMAIVDERLAALGSGPSAESISLDELERRLRTRHAAA